MQVDAVVAEIGDQSHRQVRLGQSGFENKQAKKQQHQIAVDMFQHIGRGNLAIHQPLRLRKIAPINMSLRDVIACLERSGRCLPNLLGKSFFGQLNLGVYAQAANVEE